MSLMSPRVLAVCLSALVFPSVAMADAETDAIKESLQKRYPATKILEVNESPMPGVYEVVLGKNIVFTNAEGRYFLFGHMFDMQAQRDMTAEKKESLRKIDWADLDLSKALTFVKGKGQREIAVFSDPDCPYCRRIEAELDKLDNVKIHLFPYPLAMHKDAERKASIVLCSKDPKKAWKDMMLKGKEPVGKDACRKQVTESVEVGQKIGVSGTPTIISKHGRQLSGAVPADRIDAWLADAR